MSERVTDMPIVDPSELSRLGVIQELNRRVLHPLGLAIGWTHGEDVLRVYDSRDDPEGVRFEGIDLADGLRRFEEFWGERVTPREAGLGYVVQPVNDPAATG